MIGYELINPGLDRTDVRGDWRLSHLGDTSSPYLSLLRPARLPPPLLLLLALLFPSTAALFLSISSRSVVRGSILLGAGKAGGARRYHRHWFLCLLDLLILLHLNFINCSTGPEAEKNENRLCGNSFLSLAPLLLFDLI